MNYQALNDEILKCYPDLTADEAVDAGKNLVALLKILHEAARENPELEVLINAQMKGRYVTCWRKDKTRIYIREEEFTKQIRSILNRIKLPDCIVTELQKELKTSKAAERKFCTGEVARLKTEQNKLKQKMDALFDMRLDGELDRETFDLKRNEIQIKITRLNNKIVAHEKADNSFDETILGLLDIATKAGYIFEKSANVDLKRLLLKFVFENITLTEISYKLRFPFDEFVNLITPKRNKPTPYEPMPSLINQGLQANHNENVQPGYMNFCEPQNIIKKQEIRPQNLTSVQSGWRDGGERERKSAQIYSIFVSQHDKILAMNEQVLLIRGLLAA